MKLFFSIRSIRLSTIVSSFTSLGVHAMAIESFRSINASTMSSKICRKLDADNRVGGRGDSITYMPIILIIIIMAAYSIIFLPGINRKSLL